MIFKLKSKRSIIFEIQVKAPLKLVLEPNISLPFIMTKFKDVTIANNYFKYSIKSTPLALSLAISLSTPFQTE